MATNPVPTGYHTVTPFLVVRNVAGLIDFLQAAFDASESERVLSPDGAIMHAEVRIGDSLVMMGEANENNPTMPGMLYVYLQDADDAYRRALAAGASSIQEPEDQFYGDRTAGVRDASGNVWWLATRLEDLPVDEMQRRAYALEQQA